MKENKLPYSRFVYFSALISCIFFFLGGATIVFALASFFLAKKAEKIYQNNKEVYTNIKQIKKGKVIAIFGIILNVIILGITIWTLYTIGWEAWSEEFIRKWNEGLEQGGI